MYVVFSNVNQTPQNKLFHFKSGTPDNWDWYRVDRGPGAFLNAAQVYGLKAVRVVSDDESVFGMVG
jgi:hypothetical protein